MQIRARPWLELSPAEMHLSAGIVVIVLLVVGIVFNIFRVSVQIREIRGSFCLEVRGEGSALRAVVGSSGYAL